MRKSCESVVLVVFVGVKRVNCAVKTSDDAKELNSFTSSLLCWLALLAVTISFARVLVAIKFLNVRVRNHSRQFQVLAKQFCVPLTCMCGV